MKKHTDIIKGVHPGFILERELKRRKLRKGPFAISIQEYPQTLGAITKGRRDMNIGLALKIERSLGFEEGYFMILQVYYDIEKEKRSHENRHPDFNKLRPVLFWDTKMEKIDWQRQKRPVIKRVFERGNAEEKKEIARFYGIDAVNEILKKHEK